MPRFRFSEFTLSPRKRLLLRGGRELPLIPRYFDLLVFLVERRGEAVHRRDIFDCVWTDVIVSDSALSQAIRTLRRTLDDDPRDPRFIRTIPRHGYRFVFADVVEEEDGEEFRPADTIVAAEAVKTDPEADPFEPLLDRVTRPAHTADEEEERHEAAELLHALGTEEALRRLGARPGHTIARALLRDARWQSPNAHKVPVLGGPEPVAVARELIALRVRHAGRAIAARWAGGSAGGGVAGLLAGAVGGVVLASMPGSAAPFAVVPVLAAIGAGCGALGGAGVAVGLSLAEAAARSWRRVAVVGGAAAGGMLAGAIVQVLSRWGLAALVGVEFDSGGALEGLVLGGAAGLGYAMATSRVHDGLAAPRGRRRWYAAALTALFCGLGACALALSGRPLVGGTLHAIAREARGSQITLSPLGQLVGETGFGPISQSMLGFGEGAAFGLGLAFGLTRRRNSGTSHRPLTDR